jgi:hypothetical protein
MPSSVKSGPACISIHSFGCGIIKDTCHDREHRIINKLEAKEYLMKAKIYRLFAIVSALVGLGLFLFLFFHMTHGNVMEIANNPMAVVILVFPFIPAFIFSRTSRNAEKKLKSLLEEPDAPAQQAAKPITTPAPAKQPPATNVTPLKKTSK